MSYKHEVFTDQLLRWHESVDRELPWKETRDAYKIWISEIVLQQTRVAQGMDYYLRLVKAYPTVTDLANAPEDELMRLWQGLGYYSRARNLHKAAKQIVEKHNGIFPKTYKEVLALPGIGPYTAAAVCSFAYELPHAVVDGNVYRVLSRYFGVETAIDTTAGQKEFRQLSQACLGEFTPSRYNQAIMDFGALHCTPKSPKCEACDMQQKCVAYQNSSVNRLPFKSKSIKRSKRYFYYFFLRNGDKTWIRKRDKKDIWQGLYELPLIETDMAQSQETVLRKAEENFELSDYHIDDHVYTATHRLSHQDIITEIYTVDLKSTPKVNDAVPINITELEAYAFPVLLNRFLEQQV